MKRSGSQVRKAKADLRSAKFTVSGQPVSSQAGNKKQLSQWVESVRSKAQQHWSGAPLNRFVHVSITYCCREWCGDIDNLAKPILDALQGIIYRDDHLVRRLTLEWIDLLGAIIVDRDIGPADYINDPMSVDSPCVEVAVQVRKSAAR